MAEEEWQKRHREIEELHRTIQARMDESDRRAAAREKERAERRAAGNREMYFQFRVRKANNKEGEPRFTVETREIENPSTMILGSSGKALTESELRKTLTEIGLTLGEIQSAIDKAIE